MLEDTIKKIEAQIEAIPVLSPVTSELLGIISEPNHSLHDVVAIVETDAVLTSLVLKTVNSAAYALERPIETVSDAILFLGDTIIAGLALRREKSGVATANLSGYLADADSNWAHALKTAIAARYFAKRFSGGKVREGVAYTAGILHDIGKSLISTLFTDDQFTSIKDTEFIDLEKEILGISHAEAGYMLAIKWKLPAVMCDVIRWHHEPSVAQDDSKVLTYIIHLADLTAMMSGSGTGIDTMRHTIDSNYSKYLSISDRDLELAFFEIQLEYNTTFNAIQASFESLKSYQSVEKNQ